MKKPTAAVSRYLAALGRKGGKARAASLTPEQLSAIGRKGGKLGGRPKGSSKKPSKS